MRFMKIAVIVLTAVVGISLVLVFTGRMMLRDDQRVLARVIQECKSSTAEFSARKSTSVDGVRAGECIFYATPGKTRSDFIGARKREVLIARYDKGLIWKLFPSLGLYETVPRAGVRAHRVSKGRPAPLYLRIGVLHHLHYLGTSTINGRKCEGFCGDYTNFAPDDSERTLVTVWVDPRLNITVKEESVSCWRGKTSLLGTLWLRITGRPVPPAPKNPLADITSEYSNIKETRLPGSLFELPRGYKKYVRRPGMPTAPGSAGPMMRGPVGMPGMPPMPLQSRP
jgi:hypothetical protein